MITRIKHVFLQTNILLFVCIAFTFQFILLLQLKSIDSPNTIGLYQLKGDAKQYISYCENLYLYGSYFEGSPKHVFSYTNRMPGMCVLYIPLRFFFNQHWTLNIFILLQVLLSAISSYLLAISAKKIIKSDFAFYGAFILYGTGMYCANYNHRLYTESLALSSIILSLYFYLSYLEKRKLKHIILFALFITWCVFLRPFIAPFIGLAGLYFFILLLKKQITPIHFFSFLLPIFIIFGSWTYRNFVKTNTFMPLQSGWYDGDKALHSQYMFIRSFGLEWQWWNQNSEHSWFMTDECLNGFKISRPNDSIFFKNRLNRNMFTNGLTIDSLKKARYDCWQSNNPKISETKRDSFAQSSTKMFERFISCQQEKHPFDYYISYRMRVMQKLIVQIHGASLVSIKYPFNVGLLFIDALYNTFIFIIGYISILFLLFYRKNWNVNFLSIIGIPIFIIAYFAFHLRVYENRYITLAFPFLIICSLMTIKQILEFKMKYIILFILSTILISSGVYSVITDIKW